MGDILAIEIGTIATTFPNRIVTFVQVRFTFFLRKEREQAHSWYKMWYFQVGGR